ncbi:MAG: 2-dehydropantoate 2-reductase [Gemmatimonadetes bacterium]|nr:2-dehydropantoate 2-reductase [Gemmatimonadota bacterium]
MTTRRIAVVGIGAIGGLFGGRLAAAGHQVTFIARGATLAALRERGLVVDSPEGDLRLHPVVCTDDPTTVGPVDLVLVCVKAGQVAALAPTLRPLVANGTLVIPMQNGVEASGQLAAALGDAALEGYSRVIAEAIAPAHIRHVAVTPTLAFAPRVGATSSPAPATLAGWRDLFRGAGLAVEDTPDVQRALWEKFMFVEPLGAVGGAARVPFGELLAVPETRALLDACVREIRAIGVAHGVTLGEDSVASVWARYDKLAPEGTASLQRDLMAGRPSEFDAQTAAICRMGRQVGVTTPAHYALYAVLAPQARQAR